ncbi:anthranilate synthase component 1/salicylate synthetase [Streptomyces sp. Amel2xB2]|uniref:salicylate synthase n=1 Tax=Streptomyces sp. Amel2xB2 TaxID=1305829 RepID=UPI000DB9C612|nr:salicylate synthase [Streptomyces sp. Amel2xB2]RAJ67166.1 anthranilate synthase component 1/salicylate synthetase [Streptomyces sp. Amel2xB2]
MSRCYAETRVELRRDPLLTAAALAASGLHGEYLVHEGPSEWSYGGGALATLTLDREGARLSHDDGGDDDGTFLPWDGPPLDSVRALLARVPVEGWRAYGWAAFELSYATGGAREHLGAERLLHLVVPRTEIRFTATAATVRAADEAGLAAAVEALDSPAPPLRSARPLPPGALGAGRAEYTAAVEATVRDIADGRLQKSILSRAVDVPGDIDMIGTYVLGRRANTPARSFLLDLGGIEAAGFSPETVVEVTGDGLVTSQPLAGTRALTDDPGRNGALREELLTCPKEVHEHAVSVKAGVDELADVCEPGSVAVSEFMAVRERGSVQHLASRVTGRLSGPYGPWDAFGAVFPAVTASGIPKSAAYEAIRRHEPGRRGLYSGAVLVADHSGALDAALVLRSVFRAAGRTWLRAGAGVVSQSSADREFEETAEKLRSVSGFLVPSAAAQDPAGPPLAGSLAR